MSVRPPLRRLARPASYRSRAPFFIDTAGQEDDTAIRRLLRDNVFPGEISLSLEREPDSFAASTIEGDVYQTVVAREGAAGSVIATAGRSIRDAFVNGHPARLGYLGRLRVDPAFRQRRLLDEGFAHCRRLHQGGDARIYLLSVVAGNAAARRMLERGHPGWPAVHAVDRFMTLAIPVRRVRSRRAPADLRIVSGQTVGAAALVECLRRSNRRHQFAPCWTMADLESPERTRGLELNDFVVGVRGGEIRGCLACWDQRAFKQVVVRGYSHRLAFWRPAVNLTSRWTGIPPLPAAGRRLEFAYLSHVAVDGDDPDVFEALVLEGCQRAITKDVEYVLMGLSARSPLLRRAELAFRHRAYGSMLYVAFWPDGERFVGGLDGRPSNPELAIL